MEEKKQNKKLTYEELTKAFGDLHLQYQKLADAYQKAVQALQSKDFEYSSFYLSMLFKVMEHPEMYSEEFSSWCAENIEAALRSFDETMRSEMKETPNEKTGEAE